MNWRGKSTMVWWSGRELARHPAKSLLLAACLATLTLVIAIPLLFTQAFAETSKQLLEAGPSLVVRRVDSTGWRPLPAEAAAVQARAVVGVTKATPRVWGTVLAGDTPITVVGVPPGSRPPGLARIAGGPLSRSFSRLESTQALIGPGIDRSLGDSLVLLGSKSKTFEVRGVLPPSTAMVARDVAFVQWDEARELLGLLESEASDLTVSVFHPEEQEAILPELSRAFEFPVRITTRDEALKRMSGRSGRRGSLVGLMLAPALLAMMLLTIAQVEFARADRHDVGLLKALGWGARDILSLRLLSACLVGLPAITFGLTLSTLALFVPGVTWPSAWLLGVPSNPALTLSPTGALLVLVEVLGLVFVPFAAATVLPTVRHAAALPSDLMDEAAP